MTNQLELFRFVDYFITEEDDRHDGFSSNYCSAFRTARRVEILETFRLILWKKTSVFKFQISTVRLVR